MWNRDARDCKKFYFISDKPALLTSNGYWVEKFGPLISRISFETYSSLIIMSTV